MASDDGHWVTLADGRHVFIGAGPGGLEIPKTARPVHGGGAHFTKPVSHAEAAKSLKAHGFQKAHSNARTESQKMGRSQAYTSSKVQTSSYVHPEGHVATLKTVTPKYGDGHIYTTFDVTKPVKG